MFSVLPSMPKILASLLQWFTKTPSPVPSKPSPEALPKKVENVPKETERGIGTGDAQLKMESARCDLHPLYRLGDAVIERQGTLSLDAVKVQALHCSKIGCNRYYTPEYGYFWFVAGEPLDFRGEEGKPKCSLNHESQYMIVAKSSEAFLWVCPEPGCTNGVAYQES
jgi:hypothetical protein